MFVHSANESYKTFTVFIVIGYKIAGLKDLNKSHIRNIFIY